MTDQLVHFKQKQHLSSFHNISRIKTACVKHAIPRITPYPKKDLLTTSMVPCSTVQNIAALPINTEDTSDLIIPVTEQRKQYKREETIKEGLILCTRVEGRYTKKKTTTGELQLRKSRLRWRQFNAVLSSNKLELYHVTVKLIKIISCLCYLLICYLL